MDEKTITGKCEIVKKKANGKNSKCCLVPFTLNVYMLETGVYI